MSGTGQEHRSSQARAFMAQFVFDLGAAMSAALVMIGDRLGLYEAMRDDDPVSAEQLAERTGTDPATCANGPPTGGRRLRDLRGRPLPVNRGAVARASSTGQPRGYPGAFQVATALTRTRRTSPARFRTGMAAAGTITVMSCSPAASGSFARLCREPHQRVDPGARRRPGQARAGRAGGRHRGVVGAGQL